MTLFCDVRLKKMEPPYKFK